MKAIFEKYLTEKYIRTIFNISIVLKGIDGFLEVIGGILLLFINPTQIATIIGFLTYGELIEDPRDITANYLVNISHHFSVKVELFIAIYLLTHGIIKIIIVTGLLRKKLWIHPLAIVVFSIFAAYQVYRYTHSHSVGLIIFTVFDIFIILLTWHEYRLLKELKTRDQQL